MTVFSLTFWLYLALLFIGACASLHYFVFLRQAAKWKKSNIPFLKPIFLIGHKYFTQYKYPIAVHLDRIYKDTENYDLIAFFMGSTPMILVRNPTLINQIFKKNFDKTHQNGMTALESDEIFQNSMFLASDRNKWRFQRSVMAPSFSSARLHESEEFGKIKKQAGNLMEYLENAQLSQQPVNVKDVAMKFIVDSIALWGFGEDTNCFQRSEKFHQMTHDFFKPTMKKMLQFLILSHFPSLQMFDSFKIADKKCMSFLRDLLIKNMMLREKSKVKHKDFIDHLGSLKGKVVADTSDENADDSTRKYKEIRFKQMLGLTLAVFAASMQTPGNLACYALHLISLHPDYQRRIKREVDEAMEKNGVSEITNQVIEDLQFTEQCVLETARLYPALPFIVRNCTEDFKVPGTDYFLKEGDKVLINPLSMHQDPKFYNEPDKFDPERFHPENRSSMSPETFVAYGYGPKKCPAYKIGNFLVVTFLASILQKYEVKPRSHSSQIDATGFHPLSFTHECKYDILVDLVPRETTV